MSSTLRLDCAFVNVTNILPRNRMFLIYEFKIFPLYWLHTIITHYISKSLIIQIIKKTYNIWKLILVPCSLYIIVRWTSNIVVLNYFLQNFNIVNPVKLNNTVIYILGNNSTPYLELSNSIKVHTTAPKKHWINNKNEWSQSSSGAISIRPTSHRWTRGA